MTSIAPRGDAAAEKKPWSTPRLPGNVMASPSTGRPAADVPRGSPDAGADTGDPGPDGAADTADPAADAAADGADPGDAAADGADGADGACDAAAAQAAR